MSITYAHASWLLGCWLGQYMGTIHRLLESVMMHYDAGEAVDDLPIPSKTCPPIIPEWPEAPEPPRKWMRIPKATVKSIVPETINTLSLRTFKITNPRRDPVMTEAKLMMWLVPIHIHKPAQLTCTAN